MPVISLIILDGAAVSGAADEPGRLMREGTVRSEGKRPERIGGGVDSIRIDLELGSRRGIFQIIDAATLRHPGAFGPGRHLRTAFRARGAAVILPGHLETMISIIGGETGH